MKINEQESSMQRIKLGCWVHFKKGNCPIEAILQYSKRTVSESAYLLVEVFASQERSFRHSAHVLRNTIILNIHRQHRLTAAFSRQLVIKICRPHATHEYIFADFGPV